MKRETIRGCGYLLLGTIIWGCAFVAQSVGQQLLPPTPASLIMSLESVFAVPAGWVILGQGLSNTELLGCGLVFVGVILSQTGGSDGK